ncbi:hypothetical protein HPP92_025868 [Vanilla planifolia]|uniref:RRM domain-containing protein n=1 Tax=Vanilla planifolia TaxID=51239 RepID=A0A835U857_VANPL|nr:hypothetical protein HPP92_025868 [Vanilla planifolia]
MHPMIIICRMGPVGRGSVGGFDKQVLRYNSGRTETALPPDASNTLFVEGLPSSCTRREVSHVFCPFVGFHDVKLVNKESRNPGGNPLVLCFVDFSTTRQAAVALVALQENITTTNTCTEDRLCLQHFHLIISLSEPKCCEPQMFLWKEAYMGDIGSARRAGGADEPHQHHPCLLLPSSLCSGGKTCLLLRFIELLCSSVTASVNWLSKNKTMKAGDSRFLIQLPPHGTCNPSSKARSESDSLGSLF